MFVIKRAVGIVQADWDKSPDADKGDADGGDGGDEEQAEDQPEEQKEEGPKEYSDEELEKRIDDLTESVTLTAWEYLRRGLFDRHKVVVISILCFRIKVKRGLIPNDH